MRIVLWCSLILVLAGCDGAQRDLSRAAGYRAPADFTTGIGEVRFFASTDGRTVFWECPFYNHTQGVMLCTVSPALTVKDEKGAVVWCGTDQKDWRAAPGEQGYVGGKFELPADALRPTYHWEHAGAASASANDR
jgi:hypothetical protein